MAENVLKCDVLVVDTAGFLTNAALAAIGKEITTVRAVVTEIRDKATKERLQVLPYEIQFREPMQEDLKHVTEFSKKTGDFSTLSAVDLRVLALALRMEKEANNGDISHLRTEPTTRPTVEPQPEADPAGKSNLPGFYRPDTDDEEDDETDETESDEEEKDKSEEIAQDLEDLNIVDSGESASNDANDAGSEAEDEEEEDSTGEEEDDDEEGWITPSNIKEKIRQMEGLGMEPEQKHVRVACMTTDFAMQNVLKQLGLNVFSVNGLLIRETRTWNLRCYSCYHVTTVTSKVFCPKCGNKTLKRVAVTRNDDGSARIHINFKRPLDTRGKKFSLPKPKGGKRAVNPILTEDQNRAQLKLSRKAMVKTDALDPDYIAGESPFVLHDVTSKSAMIGVHAMQKQTGHSYYWNKKNPNAVGRKTGNRKKASA